MNDTVLREPTLCLKPIKFENSSLLELLLVGAFQHSLSG